MRACFHNGIKNLYYFRLSRVHVGRCARVHIYIVGSSEDVRAHQLNESRAQIDGMRNATQRSSHKFALACCTEASARHECAPNHMRKWCEHVSGGWDIFGMCYFCVCD